MCLWVCVRAHARVHSDHVTDASIPPQHRQRAHHVANYYGPPYIVSDGIHVIFPEGVERGDFTHFGKIRRRRRISPKRGGFPPLH